MKTNYSATTEIDVLEEPQLDFKYYVNPVQKRSSVKPKKNETLNVLSLFSVYYSKAKYMSSSQHNTVIPLYLSYI